MMMNLASHNIEAPGAHQELIDTQKKIVDAIASLGTTVKGVRLDLLIELPCAG